MIALGASTALEGFATTATTVTYTVMGLLLDTSTPPIAQGYEQLAQGQLASSAASIYNPGGTNSALVSSIHLFNTSASASQTVNLYASGTTAAHQIATVSIPSGGFATYEDGSGWKIFNSSGLQITGGILYIGSLGTESTAVQTGLTASSANLVTGSLFQLTTGYLNIGTKFRWNLTVIKTTAAGVATWTLAIKYGTNGTTADAAIATYTSGTNSALADRAFYVVDCVVTGLGSGTTATATSMVHGTNQATDITGLGSLGGAAPGSTAGFNSTATNPFFHLDITPGASAVMTCVCMAEQIHV